MNDQTPADIEYFCATKNWKKIKPHLQDRALCNILVNDFNKFTMGRWRKPFKLGQYPCEFESYDWASYRKGRRPEYWKYVKYSACHWLVNFNLRLAMLVEPDREWRILESDDHSTTWDGKKTLFDFNFQALRVPAAEAFLLAREGKEHAPGKLIKVPFAIHYAASVVVYPLAEHGFEVFMSELGKPPQECHRCETLALAKDCALYLARELGLDDIDDRTQLDDPRVPNVSRLEDFEAATMKRFPALMESGPSPLSEAS